MKKSNGTPINLIGLARKGGNVAVGRDAVRAAVHRSSYTHLFLANDAGDAVSDEMRTLSKAEGVPLTEIGSKESLGKMLGRVEVAIVAITDRGLAEAINEAIRRQV